MTAGASATTEDLATTGAGGALLVPASTALANSWRVAVDATLLALLLGVLVSAAVSRRPRPRAQRHAVAVLDSVFMLPLGVSAVTIGFGFLVTLDRPPLDLRASPVLVPIAQAMVALPLVVRTLAPVLRSRRPAAAPGGRLPRRVPAADRADRRPAGRVAAAARRDRLRVRGVPRRVRRDQLPGPAGRGPPSRS